MTLPVRAKRGYIRGQRIDKSGRVVDAKLVPTTGLGGAISGKEMEQMMLQQADEMGASADDVVVETYEAGEAPRESNPAQGDRFERFTRTVTNPAQRGAWDRIFGEESDLERMKRRGVLAGTSEEGEPFTR
jgi:hypothetical protein